MSLQVIIAALLLFGARPAQAAVVPPRISTPTAATLTGLTVNWDRNGNDGSTAYSAQTSTEPGFSTIASSATTAADAITHSFTGLSVNTTYYTRVIALVGGATDYTKESGYPVSSNAVAGIWHFDEGTGGTTADSSGNGNTGTLTNSPAWVTGRFGQTLSFNGSNQYVNIPDNPAIRLGAGDLTIGAWFNTTSGGGHILDKANSGSPYEFYRMGLDGGGKGYGAALDCGTGGCGYGTTRNPVYGTTIVNDGKWHYMTLRRTGVKVDLFIDGVLDGTQSDSTAWNTDSAASLSIGAISGGASGWFNGKIDEVFIASRALSDMEIRQVMGSWPMGTLIQAPTNIYFDEITTYTITAAAYAATPAFSNLDKGASGTNITTNTYSTWHSTGNYWTTKTVMPTVRRHVYGAAVGGKIYVIGGWSGGYFNRNEEYDPASNAWVTKAQMPGVRANHTATALNEKIYVVGGDDGVTYFNKNEEYDPAANVWTTKAPMPTRRSGPGAAAAGGKLYLFGGSETGNVNKNEEYDPVTNTWTTKTTAPTFRHLPAAATVDGKIYLLGGAGPLNVNEVYNPGTDTWTTKAVMPTARNVLSAVAVGGKIYSMGGNNGSVYLNVNEEYDTVADVWATKPVMPSVRGYHAAAAVGGKIYAIGGFNGSSDLNVNEEYDPGTAKKIMGLSPNTSYTFKAKARNVAGTETSEVTGISTYTLAGVPGQPPGGASTFTAISSASLTVNWSSGSVVGGYNPLNTTLYLLQVSTMATFAPVAASSQTYNLFATVGGLAFVQTTYYAQVKAINGDNVSSSYTLLGSTATGIEPPTNIVFDEISTYTITAAAYAASPAFTSLEKGLSGTNIATNTYGAWHSTGNYWTTKAQMPTPRQYVGVTTVGGKIYAIGGNSGVDSGVNEVYDPVSNTWVTKTAMPTARAGHAQVVVSGKIYAIGGQAGYLNKNEEYDPVANVWTTKASMPTPRRLMGGGVVNEKAYIVGGEDSVSWSSKNEEYDPATNTWATKAVLSTARAYLAVMQARGKIYAIAGYNGAALNKNEEYNPGTDTWATKAVMPSARWVLAGAATGNKIYVIGGLGPLNTNEEYDVVADTWVARPAMPTARGYTGGTAAGGKIYILGGSGPLNKNEEYDPGVGQKFTGLTPNTLYTFKAKARNLFGAETTEITGISTYTLAGVPGQPPGGASTFTAISGASITVNWSSGSVVGGYNPLNTTLYLAQISTMSNFTPVWSSSQTYNLYAQFSGLSVNMRYYAQVKAINGDLVSSSYTFLGSTLTAVLPPAISTPTAPTASGLTVNWTANGNDASTLYSAQASTEPSFTTIASSVTTAANATTQALTGLSPNTTYYTRVIALTAGTTSYAGESGYPISSNSVVGIWHFQEGAGSVAADSSGRGNTGSLINTPTWTTGRFGQTLSFNGSNQYVNIPDNAAIRLGANDLTIGAWFQTTAGGGHILDKANGSSPYEFYRMGLDGGGKGYGAALDCGTGGCGYGTTRNPVYGATTVNDGKWHYMTLRRTGVKVDLFIDGVLDGTQSDSTAWNTDSAAALSIGAVSGGASGWFNGKIDEVLIASRALSDMEIKQAMGSWPMATAIETPTNIVFDEISTGAITAAAYAVSPAFSNLDKGASGTNIATNTYSTWHSTGNYWTTKTSMPTPRFYVPAAGVGGKVYVIGGYGASVLNVNEEYDPASNAWTTKAQLPTPRSASVAVPFGNKIYVIGGTTDGTQYHNTNEEYDPTTNAWTTKAILPTPRDYPAGAATATRIYVIGGENATNAETNVNEEYDPAANTWATKTSAPSPRYLMGAAAVNGKVYLIGGANHSAVYYNMNEEFDPGANTWATKAQMPTARYHLPVAAVGGKIFAIGGYTSGTVNQNEEYDPASNTWRSRPALPTMRYGMPLAAAGGKIYAVGGNSGGAINTNQEYDPGVGQRISGLAANTSYTFKAKARNVAGTETSELSGISTYTLAGVPGQPPGGASTFTAISSASLTVNWSSGSLNGGYNPLNTTLYLVQLSTMATFAPVAASSQTYNLFATVGGLTFANATYYAQVKAINGDGVSTAYTNLGSTATAIEAPTNIVFEEISTYTITASAYVLTPAFTGLERGISGTNITTAAAYGVWHSTGNYWTTKAQMPTPRHTHSAAALGGKLYAIGGLNGTYRNVNEEYDPASNAWTTKAQMPTQRSDMAATVVGSKIYVIGGYDGGAYRNLNEEYDPVGNSWTTKAQMPTARIVTAIASANGKIYVIGGSPLGGADINVNEEYNPTDNTWATKAAMPTARQAHGMSMLGNKIYAIGGSVGGTKLNVNEEYDPASNTWATKAPLIGRRSQTNSAVSGGKLYMFGGLGGSDGSTVLNTNEEYDVAADTWVARAVMPTARQVVRGAMVAGKIYVFGGYDGAATRNVNEEYDPGTAKKITGLTPNTSYTFKAKARNLFGAETSEITGISTYTLAGVPGTPPGTTSTFTAISGTSITVNWSSGSAAGGYNPLSLTAYLVQISTMSTFLPVWDSSQTYNLNARFFGLTKNTRYYAQVKAINGNNMSTAYTNLGSTSTAVPPPLIQSASAATASGLTVNWLANGNDSSTVYRAQVSTEPLFSTIAGTADSSAGALSQAVTGLSANTTYYTRAIALINGTTSYATESGYQSSSGSVVGVWHFEDNALDSSENAANNGTTANAAYAAGRFGRALSANGSSTYSSLATVGFSTVAFTVELWVKLTAWSNYQDIVQSATDGIDANRIALERGNATTCAGADQVAWLTANAAGTYDALCSQTNLALNTWYFIAATFDTAGNKKLYINGLLENSNTAAGKVPETIASTFHVGYPWNATAARWLNGTVDEVRISSRVLPASEILLDMGNTPLVTLVQTPTNIVFDEISTHSITAAAYAATPAFSNLDKGISGTNITTNTYAAWHSTGNYWGTRAQMPTARYGFGSVVVGGKIYAFGGHDVAYLNKNEEYDPASNIWTTKTNMPTVRAFLGAAAAGEKIYAFGGSIGSDLNKNEEYDPVANTWATKADMPTNQSFNASAGVGGKVYAIGGYIAGYLNKNQEYNPATNAWSVKTSMPTPRSAPSAAAVNGKIYVIGGEVGGPSLNKNEEYNPGTDTWTTKAVIPTARYAFTMTAMGGKLYAIGGSGPLNTNEEYDPTVDAWATKAAMITARNNLLAAAVGGKVYVIGGSGPLNANEEYDPGTAAKFTGLTANTLYTFKAKARNLLGVETSETGTISTYTLAAVPGQPPTAVSTYTAISSSVLTVNWSSGSVAGGYNPLNTTLYLVQLSTMSTLTPVAGSSSTYNLSATFSSLNTNATYYAQVKAINGDNISTAYTNLGSTATAIETPTTVVFDEISTHTITASAYAATPAFTGLERGISGTDMAIGGAYAAWHSSGNYWTSKAVLSSVRYDAGAAVYGGKVYAIGGYNAGYLNLNDAYDPASNSWSAKTVMSTPRYSPAAVAVGNKIYVLGGANASALNVNEEYDPVGNTWATKQAMPTPRSYLSAAAVNDKIYVIGGSGPNNINEEYDPSTNAWTTKTSMPTPRFGAPAAVVAGKIYVLGGNNGSNLNVNEEYSPSLNSWTTKTQMRTARSYLGAGAVGGKIYAMGGNGNSNINEEYDPAANQWLTRTAMITGRANLTTGVAAVGGKLYVLAGNNGGNLNVNEEYDPGTATKFAGLTANTSYSFKAKARNLLGVETSETGTISTYTLAAVPGQPPVGVSTFTAISSSALTVNWSSGSVAGGYNPLNTTLYLVQLSTMSTLTPVAGSSSTYNLFAIFSSLNTNATYYAQVKAINGDNISTAYTNLGSTATAVETPTTVVFDEISTHTIVASAYAATPAFTGLERGISGTDIAIGGAYAAWHSSGNYWTTKTVMPTVRGSLAAAAVGGKIYAIGGTVGVDPGVNKNEEYDPASNAWTAKADMPTTRFGLSAAAAGGKIYAVGGQDGAVYLNKNEEYDPAANAWTTKAQKPTIGYGMAVAAAGGKIYAFGGEDGASNNKNEEYDPATNTWATKAVLPTIWQQMGAATVAGKIYVFGGVGAGILNRNEEYDPAANSWTAKANMPTRRHALAAAAAGGKIYAFGGYDGTYLNVNEEYDPAANIWMTKPVMFSAQNWQAAATVGGRIYVIGGKNAAYLNINEEYDPGVATKFTGLTANTSYSFKAKARNLLGVETSETGTISTYTLAAVPGQPPTGVSTFTAISSSVLTVNWSSGSVAGGYNPLSTTLYLVQLSTMSTFAPVASSSSTYNLSATFSSLNTNATYYAQVKAINGDNISTAYTNLGSTATAIETPTTVVFDEISTHTITAAAYAATPALTGLERGISGTDIAIGGAYAAWHSTGNYWTTKASMPTERFGLAAAAVGGKIYAIGGYTAGSRNKNEEYDPASNAWIAKTDMPTARHYLAAAASGGKIYVVGGHNGSVYVNINEEYDPAANSWVTKAIMPTHRGYLSLATVGTKIYAIGGINASILNKNEEYDPATNLWTAKVDMPTRRLSPTAAAVNGKIYVIGGDNSGDQNVNEEYDPGANTWATKAVMLTPRRQLASGVVGGKIYVVGGATGSALNINEEYDPAANTWLTRTVMPAPQNLLAAAAAGGKVYTIGGDNGGNLNRNSEYDPGVATKFTGLTANTSYSFKAKARNLLGVATAETGTISTYTLAAVPGQPPTGVSTFTAISSSVLTVNWSSGSVAGGYNPLNTTLYLVQLSSMSTFAPATSSSTYNLSATFSSLNTNATYYAQVKAINGDNISTAYTNLGSTATAVETPTNIFFDEISTHSITAAAYASSSAFTGLERGISGTDVSINAAYAAWHSTGNYWTTKTQMPSTRYGALAAGLGGKVYVIGGYTGTVLLNTNEEYDPVSNAWTTKTQMPTTRYGPTSAVVGGKLYALGGNNGVFVNQNEEYDPVTNAWVSKAVLPTPRYFLGAAVAAGKIYVIGGSNGAYQNINEEYDPVADSWATKAQMPTPRYFVSVAAVAGKIYAMGGNNGANLNKNEEYDPGTNSWATKTVMPIARSSCGAATVGGKMFLIGGNNGADLNKNEEYDPATNTWAAKPGLTTARNSMAMAVAGGKIYVVGGHNGSPLNVNEEYDPGVGTKFAGLTANTSYSFKAKARNLLGVQTSETGTISTYTLAAVPGQPPTGISSFTAVSSYSVTVNWSSGSVSGGYNPLGVTLYRLELSTMATFAPTFASSQTYNLSATISVSSSTTYYARVKAINGDFVSTDYITLGSTLTLSEGCTTPLGGATFTDTLTAGSTLIRGIHVTELRGYINTLRTDALLSAYSWTDPTLTANSTLIRAIHLNDLRTALTAVYTACGQGAPTYTDTITAGSTVVRTVHITELRTKIQAAP